MAVRGANLVTNPAELRGVETRVIHRVDEYEMPVVTAGSHIQMHVSCKLGFNKNYYTFTLIVHTKIVLFNKFP